MRADGTDWTCPDGDPTVCGICGEASFLSDLTDDGHCPHCLGNPEWRKVVFAADCDEEGNCPICGIDYADCPCPGPTQDGYEYREVDGELFARETGETSE